MKHYPGDSMDSIVWRRSWHKRLLQDFWVCTESVSVETEHGTMTGRIGDYMMRGINGALYVVTPDAFAATQDPEEVTK